MRAHTHTHSFLIPKLQSIIYHFIEAACVARDLCGSARHPAVSHTDSCTYPGKKKKPLNVSKSAFNQRPVTNVSSRPSSWLLSLLSLWVLFMPCASPTLAGGHWVFFFSTRCANALSRGRQTKSLPGGADPQHLRPSPSLKCDTNL